MKTTRDRGSLPLAVWRDLPDPRDVGLADPRRYVIVVHEHALRHIIGAHIARDDGPWSEWLTGELVAAVCRLGDAHVTAEQRRSWLAALAARLERGARSSLDRPLVLAYRSRPPWHARQDGEDREHGILVLPAGAILIVRSTRRWQVVTCYYPGSAAWEPDPARRWQAAVRELVRLYAGWEAGRGHHPPEPAREVRIPDHADIPARAIRSDFRFITPASWGFVELPEGLAWRFEELDAWPVSASEPQRELAPAGTAVRAHRWRLDPRRSCPYSEDHDV
jgi:hypothetical protein